MTGDITVHWKERRGVVAALVVAVVAVWGYVAYTLVDTIGGTGDEEVVVSSLPQAPPAALESDRLEFVYSGSFRDPFSPAVTEERPAALAPARPRPPAPVREPEPPRVRLLGLVNGTATVETAAGDVHFVRRGDDVEGARVTAVGVAGITLRKNGRSYDIPLR